ncbi:hypothetical protein ACB098_12G012200 [Castanea mollissima]
MSCSLEENGACTSQKKYKGVRQRKWGKWVSEIRVPGTQERLWLGSYSTAEAAAMARDVAFYCLHKPSTLEKLNFPSMLPSCSLRTDLSPRSVQKAASDAGMAIDAQLITDRLPESNEREVFDHGHGHSGGGGGGEGHGLEAGFWENGGDNNYHGMTSWQGTEFKEEEDLSISIEDYL